MLRAGKEGELLSEPLSNLMKWRKEPQREDRKVEQGTEGRRGREHGEAPLYVLVEDPLILPWNRVLSICV